MENEYKAYLCETTVPRGMSWPMFEDGEPVVIGDATEDSDRVCRISFTKRGFYFDSSHRNGLKRYRYGERVKRPPQVASEVDGKTDCYEKISQDSVAGTLGIEDFKARCMGIVEKGDRMIPHMKPIHRFIAWALWKLNGWKDPDECRFECLEHPELSRAVGLMCDYWYVRQAKRQEMAKREKER